MKIEQLSREDSTAETRGSDGLPQQLRFWRRNIEKSVVTPHNMAARMPELEPGRAAAEDVVGEAESWRLVRERPAAITAGNPGFGGGG